MPLLLNPNPHVSKSPQALTDANYRYRYPFGLNLKPGSDLHEELKRQILQRAQDSRAAMSNRFSSWRDVDKTLTAYIPTDEYEEMLLEKDTRKPVSTVVPLSYAAMETVLSYMVAAFLEEPIFRYTGFGGSNDIFGAMLMEKVVELQTRRAFMGLQLHTMFRDALAYGFGVVTPVWTQKMGYRRVAKDNGFTTLTGEYISSGRSVEREEAILYEGGELYNIDPYNYLPDINYPIQDVQRAEYVGWLRSDSRMEMLKREAYDPTFFNARYLTHIDGRSVLSADGSDRDRYDVHNDAYASRDTTNRADTIYMYVDLIPAEWGLGRHKVPEKWLFALSGDQVITAAAPADLDHGMYPVVVCAPEYDGYSITPISRVEMVYGMQKIIDFYYNSHVANVRKAIHDMLVIDPLMVNENDVRSPGPGKLIRLRRQAWGRGVEGAVKQLAVSDVTGGHMADASMLTSVMDRVLGSEASIQGGIQRHGERITATEFQGYQGAALTRLERASKVAAMQAVNPLGIMLASHTQQFMTQAQYVAVAGEYEEELRAEFGDVEQLLVGPLDISVNYDVVMHDGSLPSAGDSSVWLGIFQMLAGNPALAQQFDIVRIFKHLARLSGAKNLGQFTVKNPQIMPDDQLMRQAEAGNIVPLGGANAEMPGMQASNGA